MGLWVALVLVALWVHYASAAPVARGPGWEPGCPRCFITGTCLDIGGFRVCRSVCVYDR